MNSFGRIFRISIYGESHGSIVGICIDGCPPGIKISLDDFKLDIERRKPGLKGTTSRIEDDIPIIQSGIFDNYTTGSPINITFTNKNVISKDYELIKYISRPGHSDFTAYHKYKGYNDYRGGGHFSGRLTLPLVAAGVIAKKIINPIKISANILEIGGEKDYYEILDKAQLEGDSLGGIIECKVVNIDIGFGEPFFDSLESLISHIVFSIPAIKGIEFGKGFESAKMKGSDFNDKYIDIDGKTLGNNSGGINGGISNGNPIYFRVAVKPTSSISKELNAINLKEKNIEKIKVEGRHDVCIALRIPPILEAVTAIVIADLLLINKTYSL